MISVFELFSVGIGPRARTAERRGSIKPITAARMAMRGDGDHRVSLDKLIATMRETGADTKVKYKETARGGLAVNVIEC